MNPVHSLFTLKIRGLLSVVPIKLEFVVPAFPVSDQDCEKTPTANNNFAKIKNDRFMGECCLSVNNMNKIPNSIFIKIRHFY